MKRAKRKPKVIGPEYILHVFRPQRNYHGRQPLLFLVRTTKEFANFGYEILLDDKVEGNTIKLKILGLHTPASILPGIGPAKGFRSYDAIEGKILLSVQKLDGETNEFSLKAFPDHLSVLRVPKDPFITLSLEPYPLK